MPSIKYVLTRPYTIKYNSEKNSKHFLIDQYVEVPMKYQYQEQEYILDLEDMKKIVKWGFARTEGTDINVSLNLNGVQEKIGSTKKIVPDEFRKRFQIPCSLDALESISNYIFTYIDVDDGDRFLNYLESQV
ncbi:hypothetical protein SS50377_26876 [Spironucleus salmonicida]|uniref:Uncharacterized protein n=1 Tax=Spironucleus salmonicida TaxID=348837 RepID=V6LRV4_9EUKA|nr:hypothetical protein SS50377_26876 [Spironucleus salmonicida]|eukprot:EST47387.1 Hypothetical protein SS50377_12374 [Spironucleus salmonicida]